MRGEGSEPKKLDLYYDMRIERRLDKLEQIVDCWLCRAGLDRELITC